MIKRIIFDIDNTLIYWKKEYDYITLKSALEKIKIKPEKELMDKISKSINTYENKYTTFSKDKMLNKINKDLNVNYSMIFLNEWLENTVNFAIPDKLEKNHINTLNYLSEKYELVALTNWFEKYQKRRLEKIGILKYFKQIYGADEIKIKPNPESFKKAIGKNKIDECIMVGDSLRADIEGATKIGMRSIWIKSDTSDKKIKNCKIIKDISELKNIL